MQTVFDFILPRGYLSPSGDLHQTVQMRLATARDEVESLQDPRVQVNEAYLAIILLSKVVTRLGTIDLVTPQIIESLFATDFAYLEDLYERLNAHERVVLGAVCPNCGTQFQLQIAPVGDG